MSTPMDPSAELCFLAVAPVELAGRRTRDQIDSTIPRYDDLPRARGRSIGSGSFRSRNDFITIIINAIRSILLQEKLPTQRAVAAYLRDHHAISNGDAAHVRRWCSQSFYDVSWQWLKEEAARSVADRISAMQLEYTTS